MQIDITVIGSENPLDDSAIDHSYTLRHIGHHPGATFWLQNESEEGMAVTEQTLFEVLDAHFRKNF